MSRTYRRDMVYMDCNCGAPIRPRFSYNKGKICYSVQEEVNRAVRLGVPVERECDCHRKIDYYTRHNSKRDRKPWMKPTSGYKKVFKKARKAKIRNNMHNHDYDNVIDFRKEDKRNYL